MKKEDYAAEQISLKKHIDSFPSSEKKKAKNKQPQASGCLK
ncbi:hypothetical protein CLOSTMETH_03253 [[Clostridium] methylpentosum DSM 5476]|uniref:Uncharacterized protein n=1 Tax=[Clostridium] methylpentosum DSM 5476 TaxID=537013 RepID=C0EH53_9FIRM|nr:hypothetical protein CLOSTMETH_03253 [[Clostridium] methylpentosum DSM 5476]MDY3987927.1 hypothetical protein [Massilioclostridium sp.]MEE1491641.1 hypothetical protein [Massilioclostridium sp.]